MRRLYAISLITALFLMMTVSIQPAMMQAPPTDTPEVTLENFDPNNFDDPTNIDNKWLPLKPGTRWTFDGFTEEAGQRVEHHLVFVVTDLVKVIGGLRTVVVWDQDIGNGQLEESEISFYAQDNDGNVWLLGEYPEVYEDGNLVESPAWIHGFEDAQAGIIVQANPQVGDPSYAQGWGPAVNWSDRGQTDQVGVETCVPAGCYKDVLVIKEYSLDEPGALQFKYYAPDVGNVRVDWGGADTVKEQLELVSVEQVDPDELAAANTEGLKLEQRAYQLSKGAYGETSPSEYPEGTVLPLEVTLTPVPAVQVDANAPKPGHWEGEIARTEGDSILFDVLPENEIDNIEAELSIDGVTCTAEIELIPLLPDNTFSLEADAETNGILGTFDSQTTASGTVTLHECSGNPVPSTSGTDEYDWSAEWVSDEVG